MSRRKKELGAHVEPEDSKSGEMVYCTPLLLIAVIRVVDVRGMSCANSNAAASLTKAASTPLTTGPFIGIILLALLIAAALFLMQQIMKS